MKAREFKDAMGRKCLVNLENWSLSMGEGSKEGGWMTRVWVSGGPPQGVLLDIEPSKFEEALKLDG